MRIDQLGHTQPDTRNPVLITAMEVLGETENRYSGIPRIRHAMKELLLPEPVFTDNRGIFTVILYNDTVATQDKDLSNRGASIEIVTDDKDLLAFCKVPRTRQEIIDYLSIASAQYNRFLLHILGMRLFQDRQGAV